ncbi:MAG: hypothetical protein ACK5C0_14805 [Candidatus Kapaibacterium sp.]|jgi:hypothetical protein|nr:hypothetical protein [Candidatus Kapabacteria bacterium]
MKIGIVFCALIFLCSVDSWGQRIVLVDDDTYSKPDHYPRVKNAVTLAAQSLPQAEIKEFVTGVDAPTVFDSLNKGDIVVWYCANTAVGTALWNGTKSDNVMIPNLLERGVHVWIMGNDFLSDRYGDAPKMFTSEDYAYEYFGIMRFVGESKKNDNDIGLPLLAAHIPKGSVTDTLTWTSGNLWYADACDIREDIIPLYSMGPSDYVFGGKKSMWMKKGVSGGNVIISTFDPWFMDVETMNVFFEETIALMANSGAVSVEEQEQYKRMALSVYPQPSSNIVTIDGLHTACDEITVVTMTGEKTQLPLQRFGNSARLSVESLPNGIYTLHCEGLTFVCVVVH